MSSPLIVNLNLSRVLEALVGLTLAMAVLRLCGLIDFRWVWIFAPVWIPLAVSNVVAFVTAMRRAWIGRK